MTDFIRFGAPSQPNKLETDLYTPLATILQNDVQGNAKSIMVH